MLYYVQILGLKLPKEYPLPKKHNCEMSLTEILQYQLQNL